MSTLPASLSVALVDDHPISTDSLPLRLRDAGFVVVTVEAAVENLLDGPDIVVCDLRSTCRVAPVRTPSLTWCRAGVSCAGSIRCGDTG